MCFSQCMTGNSVSHFFNSFNKLGTLSYHVLYIINSNPSLFMFGTHFFINEKSRLLGIPINAPVEHKIFFIFSPKQISFFIFINFIICKKLRQNCLSFRRRRRDLNPRAAQTTYTLSRGASSAT